MCPNATDPNGCTEEVNVYEAVMSFYTFINMISVLLLGIIIDYLGLRIGKILSTILFFVGMITLSALDKSQPLLLNVGATFAALGGIGMFFCNLSFSQLFTKSAMLVLGLIEGSFDASSSTFAVVKLIYDAGLSLRIVFLIHGLCGLSMGLFSGCFILSCWVPQMSKYGSGIHGDSEKSVREEEVEDIDEGRDDEGNGNTIVSAAETFGPIVCIYCDIHIWSENIIFFYMFYLDIGGRLRGCVSNV